MPNVSELTRQAEPTPEERAAAIIRPLSGLSWPLDEGWADVEADVARAIRAAVAAERAACLWEIEDLPVDCFFHRPTAVRVRDVLAGVIRARGGPGHA